MKTNQNAPFRPAHREHQVHSKQKEGREDLEEIDLISLWHLGKTANKTTSINTIFDKYVGIKPERQPEVDVNLLHT